MTAATLLSVLLSSSLIVSIIFCFLLQQPEQITARVSTHSIQSICSKDRSITQQQSKISLPTINVNTIISKIKLLADSIAARLNIAASILENTSKLSDVRNIPYTNAINNTLHGIPDYLDTSKRKIAQQILLQHKSGSFVSIAFLLSNGDVYMVEPYNRQIKLPTDNLAHRDYFIGAVTTHKPYLSQVFTTPVDGSNIATISVPIYSIGKNSNNNSIGSLIGTWNGQININIIFQQTINNKLPNLPSNNNEHLFLVDHSGNIAANLNLNIQQQSGGDNKLSLRYGEYTTKSFTNLQSFNDAINGKSGVDIEPINKNTDMYYIVYYYPVKAVSTTWAILFIHTIRLFK
jgi:cache domain-containing protein